MERQNNEYLQGQPRRHYCFLRFLALVAELFFVAKATTFALSSLPLFQLQLQPYRFLWMLDFS